MAKKIGLIAVMLLLCAHIHQALALGSLAIVTKKTQAEMGLDFMLDAERVDSEAVLVRLEIPRKGKLKSLRSISLRIGSGRPLVSAPLQTSPGKNDSWVVAFQVSPEMADKCSVDLNVPSTGRTYTIYAVELKGYVKDRK